MTKARDNSKFGNFAGNEVFLDSDKDTSITADTDDQIDIKTGGTDRVHIDSSGNVGIGTSSPARNLHISDSGTPNIRMQDTGGTNQYAELLISGSSTILQARNDTADGNIIFRGLGGGSATERMRIDSSGEVSIDSGYVTLNGNEIGGAQITIADDAVGTVVPPRNGGFLMMTTAGDTSFPNQPASAFLVFDVGNSLRVDISRSMSGGFDDAVETATGALTGTSATDGNIKVSSNTGQIEINNRLGASAVIQLTFL